MRLLRRLISNAQGAAALEFAMIAPLMFMMFVGSVEFSQAITVDRRVTQAASAIADLVARAPSEGVTTAQVDRDMSIVGQLIAPYDLSALTVEVVSVKAQAVPGNPGALNYVVDWSRNNRGGTPYTRNSPAPFGMPQGLLVAGESTIVGRAFYNYTPLIFSYFISEAFTMEEKFYLRPRNGACVHLLPIHCVTGATM
ncbi:MAG: TadE/TadG family type IV pilus assembly protein [Hyphomicrobiaceae bacterium]